MNAALWPWLELWGGDRRVLADHSSSQSDGVMEVLGPQAQILKKKKKNNCFFQCAVVFALTK